jgi:hypothetical protein
MDQPLRRSVHLYFFERLCPLKIFCIPLQTLLPSECSEAWNEEKICLPQIFADVGCGECWRPRQHWNVMMISFGCWRGRQQLQQIPQIFADVDSGECWRPRQHWNVMMISFVCWRGRQQLQQIPQIFAECGLYI